MMNQMLNITLPDDMVEMINNRVETGAYASTSDVLQAAMRLFMRTERAQDDRMAAIRAHVQAAIDDPHPGFSSEEMRQHLDALYEQNRPV